MHSKFQISMLKLLVSEEDIGVDPKGDSEKIGYLEDIDSTSLNEIRTHYQVGSMLGNAILSIIVMISGPQFLISNGYSWGIIPLFILLAGYLVWWHFYRDSKKMRLKKAIMELRREGIYEEQYMKLTERTENA